MAVYQSPSTRLFDCLRKVGMIGLLIVVLKGFTYNTSTSRQANVDTKGLRAPYSSTISTADTQMEEEEVPSKSSFGEETNQYGDDDDDDGIVNTGAIIVDGDDDDLVREQETKAATLSLHLIGERHSGTKWMSAHLQNCFPNIRFTNNPFRWKHWFQDDSIEKYKDERFVIVAQFRNSFTWTEAMRSFPHHAPIHFHLDWPDFVTRSWTMPRYGADLEFDGWTADSSRIAGAKACATGDFLPHQVIPCNANRTAFSERGIMMQSLYELRNDGSGLPYNNILELRKEKIENFLSMADYERVQEVFIVRYEEAKLNGSFKLIKELEKALGQEAACKPIEGDLEWRERTIPVSFREYLQKHVDWGTEAKIGYFPTDMY